MHNPKGGPRNLVEKGIGMFVKVPVNPGGRKSRGQEYCLEVSY